MKSIAVIYGSSSGNTKLVAKKIASMISGAALLDVSMVKKEDIEKYDNLILGTSTWGVGDLQDDWDNFLPDLKQLDLNNKVIALFGLGDSESYPDTFVDGIGTIFEAIKDKGCTIIGAVQTQGYTFDSSLAEVGGFFVGLPIDEDNESDKTPQRIEQWVQFISSKFQ